VLDAGATVLLDEKTLWPDGKFPTTVMIVRTDFLKQYPGTVQALLRGHIKALDYAAASPNEAKSLVNDGLKKLTGSALSGPVLDRAFTAITLGYDPLATTYTQLAKDSVTAGVTPTQTDLAGFLDLSALNAVLQALGRPAVDAAGLDKPKGS
jgi:NitT/TauT family transport system substrate-binding protein